MPFQLQPENDHLVISQKTKELDFPCHETSSKPHLHHDFADENEDEPSNDHAPLLKDAFSSTSTMKDDSTIGSMVAVTQAKTTAQRLRALGYIVFSAFNFSIMSTCIKYASRFMSSTETVFWRCSTAWFMNYVSCLFS
jgi:hypothetical protein